MPASRLPGVHIQTLTWVNLFHPICSEDSNAIEVHLDDLALEDPYNQKRLLAGLRLISCPCGLARKAWCKPHELGWELVEVIEDEGTEEEPGVHWPHLWPHLT